MATNCLCVTSVDMPRNAATKLTRELVTSCLTTETDVYYWARADLTSEQSVTAWMHSLDLANNQKSDEVFTQTQSVFQKLTSADPHDVASLLPDSSLIDTIVSFGVRAAVAQRSFIVACYPLPDHLTLR